MEIVAVYLQPVTMEPEGMMKPPAQSDIHLEADIHALADNPNGFSEGAWMPYLKVEYTLVKDGAPGKIAGVLMPMVASDGPHYGENVKLKGPGKYRLTLRISPPNTAGTHGQFGRHTDRLTGVQPWFKPFEFGVDFTFAGIGKKGSY
jgi:periplasmic iron binding protein